MKERTQEQIKHLEFLQAIIARMHDAATSMKRFSIVGFALGASIARYLKEPAILLFTAAAITALWLIDGKYLQTERAFRALYDGIRAEEPGKPASFDLTPAKPKMLPIRELFSWSTVLLYGPILGLLAIIWTLLNT